MLIALFSLGDHVLFDYITSGALISMLSLSMGTKNMQTLNTYCMISFYLIIVIFCEPIVLIDF